MVPFIKYEASVVYTIWGENEAVLSFVYSFKSIREEITKLLRVLNTDRHSDPPWELEHCSAAHCSI